MEETETKVMIAKTDRKQGQENKFDLLMLYNHLSAACRFISLRTQFVRESVCGCTFSKLTVIQSEGIVG